MKTRSIVLEAPGKMSLQTFDMPQIGPEDALMRIEMVGVCGSDVGMYHGKESWKPRPFPIIMGHEMVGEIVEIGTLASQFHGVRKGDRVIVEYAIGCGHCEYCRKGNYVQCESQLCYGSLVSCNTPPHLWGAYGEHMYIHPRSVVHKVSKEIPPEVAILLTAVIGNAVRWLRIKGNVSIGDTVVIEGPGQQGLAAVAIAHDSGASNIIVTGTSDDAERMALAKEFGATHCCNIENEDPVEFVKEITGGKMANIVMDVTGRPKGLTTSIDLVGKRGTIVMPGLYGLNTPVPLMIDRVIFKEVTLLGVFTHDITGVIPAIKLAESRKYPFEKLVTHRYPLDQGETAVKVAAREVEGENPIKVVIVP